MKKYITFFFILLFTFRFNCNADTIIKPDNYTAQNCNIYSYSIDANSSIIVPVSISTSGTLQITATVNQVLNNKISYILYSDSECSELVQNKYLYFVKDSNLTDSINFDMNSSGNYYLKITNESLNTINTNLKFKFAGSLGLNLKNGVTGIRSNSKYNKNVYHKLTVNSTGYLLVNLIGLDNSNSYNYITLCDNNKKDLSNTVNISSAKSKGQIIFAVKKGTYYLKVRPNMSAYNKFYAIKYSFSKVTDSSKSKKNKSPKIKQNKYYSGVILHTDSKNKYDYYKLVLTKVTKIKIDSMSYGSGSFYIKVINSNGTIKGNPLKNYVSLDKGTYYVAIYKNNNRYGGYYRFIVRTR